MAVQLLTILLSTKLEHLLLKTQEQTTQFQLAHLSRQLPMALSLVLSQPLLALVVA
jgi:hypothetical protein